MEGLPSRAIAFVAAGGLVVLYAMRGGGSYDVVVRQEMGLAIWWILGLGFAFGVLPRRPLRLVDASGVAALLALGVWVAIGFGWTESDERTTAELARIVAYAGVLLLPLAFLTGDTWRAAAGGIAAAALGVTVLSVASRLAPDSFPEDLVSASFQGQRLNYPFHYWNAVGAWAAMSIAIGLAWSAHARLVITRILALAAVPVAAVAVYLTYSRAGVVGAALGALVVLALSRNRWVLAVHAVAAAAGAAVAILTVRDVPDIAHATGSGGAGRVLLMIAVSTALCAGVVLGTWALQGDERWRMPRTGARALLAGVLVVVVVVGAAVGPSVARKGWDQYNEDPFKAGREQESAERSDPATRLSSLSGNRRNLWASALSAYGAHAQGTGAGTFEFWWNRDARNEEFVRDAHSLYLESLGELGLPGLALVLASLGALLWLALKARRGMRAPPAIGASAALIGAFAVYLVTAGLDWMWESTAVSVLALGGIAVAGAAPVGARTADVRAAPASARRAGPLAIPWRVAAAAIAVIACLIQLPGLVSTSEVRHSQASVRAGALEKAQLQANDAIAAEPWAAAPYVQRGLVEERQGRLRAARVDLLRAVAREPTNWRHPLLLARIEAELGDPRAALAAYERARRLHPLSPVFRPQP